MLYRMLCAVHAASNALRRAYCVPRILYRMPCAVYGRDWAAEDGRMAEFNSNSTATTAMLNEDLFNRDMIEI